MGLIEDELSEVKKLCEHTISGSKLVSCVQTMVRVEIKRTEHKHIIVCMQFPIEYPKTTILIELKSKTLSDKLLQKLGGICEQEAKKYLGKPQILKILTFIKTFIEEHPLCCCFDEINNIKKLLSEEDEFKLKQKNSYLQLKVINGQYFLRAKLHVPELYPIEAVFAQDLETNLPQLFKRYILAQAKEEARMCVQPPLRKKKPNEPPFKPSPSVQKTVSFLIDCIKRFPNEECQFCKEICFPADPNDIENNEMSPKHIERMYCGHLFHNQCLIAYMRQPPFGNKTCNKCKKKIYHDKWGLTDRLAEDRWAHQQARERELAEVTDFLQ